jgi:hypothetical protein
MSGKRKRKKKKKKDEKRKKGKYQKLLTSAGSVDG